MKVRQTASGTSNEPAADPANDFLFEVWMSLHPSLITQVNIAVDRIKDKRPFKLKSRKEKAPSSKYTIVLNQTPRVKSAVDDDDT